MTLSPFSSGFEEHFDKLQAVLKRLHDSNLQLEATKCEFVRHEISYMIHILPEDDMKTIIKQKL